MKKQPTSERATWVKYYMGKSCSISVINSTLQRIRIMGKNPLEDVISTHFYIQNKALSVVPLNPAGILYWNVGGFVQEKSSCVRAIPSVFSPSESHFKFLYCTFSMCEYGNNELERATKLCSDVHRYLLLSDAF